MAAFHWPGRVTVVAHESFYETPRTQVAATLRAVLAFPAIRVIDRDLLQRAIEVYDLLRLGFAGAYSVASAERTGIEVVASFDCGIVRATTVRREEPSGLRPQAVDPDVPEQGCGPPRTCPAPRRSRCGGTGYDEGGGQSMDGWLDEIEDLLTEGDER